MSERPIAVVLSTAEVGGAELSLAPVVRRLAAVRPVVVIAPGDGPVIELLAAAGAEPGPRVPLGPRLRRASRQYRAGGAIELAAASVPLVLRLSRALRECGAGAVYCNGYRAQLAGTPAAALARCEPVIWHLRELVPDGSAGRLWARLASRASLVLASSLTTAEQPGLHRVPPERVRVIPNGVDLTRFGARDREPEQPRLGMVGHLTPWKGHNRFLEALAGARQRVPGLTGAIAGASIYATAGHESYLAELRSRIDALSLGASCSIDDVPVERMPEWLAGLTLLLHCPDQPEPFGRAIVEAMAVGVPVIATDWGGAPEILGDTGVLVERGADGRLVKEVVALLGDPNRRAALAASAAARARELFDESETSDRAAQAILDLR